MNIDPTRSGKTRGIGPERLDDPGATAPVPARRERRAEPEPIARETDRVELSEAARELLRAEQKPVAAPSLAAERMKSILERVSQGYYDRPEVRDVVISRMTADLERDPAEI